MIFEKEFIQCIKEKKELSLLDDYFVLRYLKKNKSLISSIDLTKYVSFSQCVKNKKIKEFISQTRKDLREVYGLFLHQPIAKEQLIDVRTISDPRVSSILSLHRSTEERLPYYSFSFSELFKQLDAFGLPDSFSVLDVACGYNPFALQFFPRLPKQYFACDLSSEEMGFVQLFFDAVGQCGEARGFDVLSEEFFSWLQLQSFDVVFLFKAIDSFEGVKRHSSKKLLSVLPAPLLVVSFPLISIGRKNTIQSSKRMWFERFCESQKWTFYSFSSPNELFYVIRK